MLMRPISVKQENTLAGFSKGEIMGIYAVDEYTPGTTLWKDFKPATLRRLSIGTLKECANSISNLTKDANYPDSFFRITPICEDMARAYGQNHGFEASNLISVTDAAKLAGVSRQAMHQRIKAGSVAAEKIGGAWYVLQGSVEKN